MINKIEVSEVLFSPKTTLNKVRILGKDYLGTTRDPNLFVIKSNSVIKEGENLSFIKNNVLYTLFGIIYELDNDTFFVECRTYKEEFLENEHI